VLPYFKVIELILGTLVTEITMVKTLRDEKENVFVDLSV
jgi:hypothetical protein